jgi:hypothetical protein
MKITTYYSIVVLLLFTVTANAQLLRNSDLNKDRQLNHNNAFELSFSPETTNWVHTRSVNYVWDGMSWAYLNNGTYKYNADGNQTEMLLADTTRPMNHFKSINYYDTYKNSTGFIYQLWDSVGKKWDTVQGQRLLYQYDGSHYITQKVTQEWNNGWGNKSKEDYILNANGKYKVLTVYNWVGNNWQAYYMDTLCTWQGDQLASFTEKIPIPGGWRNDVRYSSVFPSGKNFIALYFTFNGTGWDSLYRFTRNYNTYGGYNHITEQYNINVWQNVQRGLYFIDSLGNYYGYELDEWDPVGKSWWQYEGTLINHTYNKSEVMLSETLSQYNKYTHAMEYKEKHVFTEFKIPPTVSIIDTKNSQKLKIYPNPASDKIFIELINPAKSVTNISLFDLNGRIILNRMINKNENPVKIDLGGLSKGMYLIEVSNGEEVIHKPVIIR